MLVTVLVGDHYNTMAGATQVEKLQNINKF